MAHNEAVSADKHEEGENYFVSMTDMMVGMLFIFIILLMSFALLFRQQTDVQVNKIADVNKLAETLDTLEERIRRRLDDLKEANQLRLRLLLELKNQLAREGLNVVISPSGDVLRLTEASIRFDPNESLLKDGAPRQNVGKVARVLSRALPRYAACPKFTSSANCRTAAQASVETVFIEGHTDETGLDDKNWTLSAERAANTYREMTRQAPQLRAIFNRRGEEILSIAGYSSTRRIDATGGTVAHATNRRIDIRFLMDTDPAVGLGEIGDLLNNMRKAILELKGAQ